MIVDIGFLIFKRNPFEIYAQTNYRSSNHGKIGKTMAQ